MDITGPEWKYGNDLWITDDKTSSFSYQSDFSSSNFLTPMYTRVGDAGGAAGGRVVHPPPSSRIEETANLAAKLIF